VDENTRKRLYKMLRRELGPDWMADMQLLGTENLRCRAGKDLTSFVAYPARGQGGNSNYRGNCSPKIITDLIKYVLGHKRYYGRDTEGFTLLDPMSGSGSSRAAADQCGVRSVLYDLNPEAPEGLGGWNALTDDVRHDADLIFAHPPYHSIIQYSGHVWGDAAHPDDLSQCDTYDEFIYKLNYVVQKLYMALRRDGRLAVLVGDIRFQGSFYSIQHDLMTFGSLEAFIVKGQYNCWSDSRSYRSPFIPIVTEYLLLFKKDGGLIVPFSRRISGTFNMLLEDNRTVTWQHLVRSVMEEKGGRASSEELYESLSGHPKAKGNRHYKDRIRAVIQEYPDTFKPCGRGEYTLAYAS